MWVGGRGTSAMHASRGLIHEPWRSMANNANNAMCYWSSRYTRRLQSCLSTKPLHKHCTEKITDGLMFCLAVSTEEMANSFKKSL